MFDHCEDIESIDFSNFDLSKATTALCSMAYCTKLKYVDFGNTDFNKLENLGDMFQSCSSLEKMVNCFNNASNVNGISYIFFDSKSLKSIDLSNFTSILPK